MAFKRRTKVKPDFSLASMTDLVFLLLIFFMITSTLVSPNAIKVDLPTAGNQVTTPKTVSVTITADLQWYVNGGATSPSRLEADLASAIQQNGSADPVVSINADKTVAIEHMVHVMKICNNLKAKVVLATQAE
ncbi:MAG: ExbD/TolR family protein [Bacteroidota bacterium]|jgi:biopolymer transport protein ExbD